MSRLSRLILIFVGVFLFHIPTKAYEIQNGLEYIVNSSSISHVPYEAVLYKCVNDVEVVTIPAEITVKYQIWTGGNNYSNQQATVPVKLYNTNIGAKSYQPFSHCKNVKKINIAAGIKTIDGTIFNCTSLEQINVNGASESYMSENGILYNKDESVLVRVPQGNTNANIAIKNSVKTIGTHAFYGCKMNSITIPSQIETIGVSAFEECTELSKVTAYSLESWMSINFKNETANPLYCAHNLYIAKQKVTDLEIPSNINQVGYSTFSGGYFDTVIIPEGVTTIGNSAFGYGVIGKISIPSSVSSVGDIFKESKIETVETNTTAIMNSRNINSYNSYRNDIKNCIVGNLITEIPACAFEYWSALESVTLPNTLKVIGKQAFLYNNTLAKIILPDELTKIENDSFNSNTKIYVNRGSTTLLLLWGKGYIPYNITNDKELTVPTIVVEDATQTTLTVNIDNYYDEYSYSTFYRDDSYYTMLTHFSDTIPLKDKSTFNDLLAECTYSFHLLALHGDKYYYLSRSNCQTSKIGVSVNVSNKSATSLKAKGSYIEGDAKVIGTSFYCNRKYIEDNPVTITGLEPNNSIEIEYQVKVSYDKDGNYHTYKDKTTVKTPSLTLTTLTPKVTNKGEAIVCATTNMDDSETHAGFEWRKTDAPDVVGSKSSEAVIFNGTMEGKIKDLDASAYWKVRAYYKSDSGNMYYGDWVGFDPSDFSYFEPTVHTYSSPMVSENSATLTGTAVEGTDEIQEQGFEYWKNPASAPLLNRASSNVLRVTAEGQRMTATLTGLSAGTNYGYRAFVKTEKGMFYGEEQAFTTEGKASPDDGNTGTPFTITTSSAGYATFYDSKSAYLLPAELTAQVVTGVASDKLKYETLGNTVPKGVAVMLTSSIRNAASYTINQTTSEAVYSGNNLLQGSDTPTMTTGNGYHYKLSFGKSGSTLRDVFGWYWGSQNGGAFQIEGHKAWLVLPTSVSAPSFTIDGETTGISMMENSDRESVCYDLQGRRISSPSVKGVYIVNGKKVLIK